jgi:transglutaminase-like putative cysteine protease
MSESGTDERGEPDAPPGSDPGTDPDGTGVEYGELALAALVVAALVVAAALLPPAGLGADDGERSRDPLRTPGGGAGEATASGVEGSPSGVPLSTPPRRTEIGSTAGSAAPLAQTPQFVVEAPRNAYWRQTAYATYTGSAWERSPTWRPMAEGVPNDDLTADGRGMDYRVTLLRPSSSLPTAWQPDAVGVEAGSGNADRDVDVQASTVGGVRATGTLPAGTTYRARSSAPPQAAGRLRAAGTDYPERIERRYTQVPAATPRRVGDFTADLVDDDATPYDAAVTVRDWLKEKPYSLNASHEAGEPVADQFVFEMERGYCQYYATAMVVMLRTQGVPARYVVGYAPGKRVGDDRYLVTADRGHAWVEVYFPDVGWVEFDPTAAGRLPVRNPQPPYDISLNRSAVAGARVAVTVAKNGTPVVGAPVAVDGERVGWTGADGRVTTTLPYAAEVTVTARPPSAATKFDGENGTAVGGSLPVDAGAPRGSLDRLAAARPPSEPLVRQTTAPNGTSRTYRSETNVTLSVAGTPTAGGGVTVAATIRDVPLRGATATLDGEPVGRTGEDGRLALSLAGVEPGTHHLRVRRASLSATTTLAVEPAAATTPTETPTAGGGSSLNLSVTAPLSLPLPGGPATVTATHNGTPVASAAVRVAGDRAGTTAANGTLGVTLPVAGSAVVDARGPDGEAARATVTGLYRNAALLGLGALGALAGVGWWLRRRGVTARGASRTLATLLSTLGTRAVAACIRAADLLCDAGRAGRRGLRRLAALPERLAARGRAALTAVDPLALVRSLWRWLARLLARGTSSARTAAGTDDGASGRRDAGGREGDADTPRTLRRAWREFVALVAPPKVRTRTPGEVARHAIDLGLPPEPVRTLTEAYRDAEYGRRRPDEERLGRVRAAIRAIREAARSDAGGERR